MSEPVVSDDAVPEAWIPTPTPWAMKDTTSPQTKIFASQRLLTDECATPPTSRVIPLGFM